MYVFLLNLIPYRPSWTEFIHLLRCVCLSWWAASRRSAYLSSCSRPQVPPEAVGVVALDADMCRYRCWVKGQVRPCVVDYSYSWIQPQMPSMCAIAVYQYSIAHLIFYLVASLRLSVLYGSMFTLFWMAFAKHSYVRQIDIILFVVSRILVSPFGFQKNILQYNYYFNSLRHLGVSLYCKAHRNCTSNNNCIDIEN
jgi:hypothetical protein